MNPFMHSAQQVGHTLKVPPKAQQPCWANTFCAAMLELSQDQEIKLITVTQSYFPLFSKPRWRVHQLHAVFRDTTKIIEPYQGAGTVKTQPDLGMGESVMIDLISVLPKEDKYSLYSDNLFTSPALLSVIKDKGYDATGTLRANRLNQCPLEGVDSMKKKSAAAKQRSLDCLGFLRHIALSHVNKYRGAVVSNRPGAMEMSVSSEFVRDEDGHYLVSLLTQRRCRQCKGNTKKACSKCPSTPRHKQCFILYDETHQN
ncbi:PiggyBac transposable element-derived protein 1 [Plakobranchus ocellatus]|uniref:PiggyBac transposable element-derived protein 1 n=1 Tax=Plakobranchus ocellatus TaxID=259542 RepID=A0AAV4BAC5_9GAST|nr:PiggyBac transposable element-derived protein 1 [Plakobranchus ocellatus]